ncbi:MAG: alpha/beta hydrolase fold domain-containing protein [Solirubrobacteraceae bacterium]
MERAGEQVSPVRRGPPGLWRVRATGRASLAQGNRGVPQVTGVAVCGDSVGGNLATATAILAKQRGDSTFAAQALLYPVTDANFDDGSYIQFADGYWLTRTGMQWYWDQYTTNPLDARQERACSDEVALIWSARAESRPAPPAMHRREQPGI